MGKQPFIPLYIGDWEQDTNNLTPLAEFALLKLTFKLFRAEKKGVFYANFRSLSVLFKSDFTATKEILAELSENKILDILEVSEGKFEIKNRRMLRETAISEKRAECGKQGGRGNTKANEKLIKNKRKAKQQQNTENEIEIEDINNEDANQKIKGALSEKIEAAITDFLTPEFGAETFEDCTPEILSSGSPLPSLDEMIRSVEQTANWRNVLEHHSLSAAERLRLFKIFLEQKEDQYRLRMPEWSEISANFYFWVPKHKTGKSVANRGVAAVLRAESQTIPRITK